MQRWELTRTHEYLRRNIGRRIQLPRLQIFADPDSQVASFSGFETGKLFSVMAGLNLSVDSIERMSDCETLDEVLGTISEVTTSDSILSDCVNSDLTLLKYWAPWCEPCHALGKEIDEWLSIERESNLRSISLVSILDDPFELPELTRKEGSSK